MLPPLELHVDFGYTRGIGGAMVKVQISVQSLCLMKNSKVSCPVLPQMDINLDSCLDKCQVGWVKLRLWYLCLQ